MSLVYLNEENFQKEVVESNIPVIIDFYADWCGPCRMMAPVFEELSAEYEGKLKFTKLNTDANQNLAMKYDISGIPALIIAKNGKEIDRIVGFAPKPMMKQQIDNILKNA